MAKKPSFVLTGPAHGAPTLDDIIALYRRLTGKEPSADEVAVIQREMQEQK